MWKRKQIAIVPRRMDTPPASTYAFAPALFHSFALAFYLVSLYSFSVAFSLLYQFSFSPLPPSRCWRASPFRQQGFEREGLPSAWCGRGTVAPPTSPPDRPPPPPPPAALSLRLSFCILFRLPFLLFFHCHFFFFFSFTSSFLNSPAHDKVIQCCSVNNMWCLWCL